MHQQNGSIPGGDTHPNTTAGVELESDVFAEAATPVRLMVDDRLVRKDLAGAALPVASTGRPRLSWVVPLCRNGQEQVAYEIRAARTRAALLEPAGRSTNALLWESGLVASAENRGIIWGGGNLEPHSSAWWSVRTTDENGHASAWAESAEIVVGPLSERDWKASWITYPSTDAAYFDFELHRGSVAGDTEFDLVTADRPTVSRAIVHFAGAGEIRLYVDGRPVNPNAKDPTDSSLKRSISRSYDVTSLLASYDAPHRFAIVAVLAHYRLVLDQPRVIAELRIEFDNGTFQTISTSRDWGVSRTSLTRDDPFYLEEHDARIMDTWAFPGGDVVGASNRLVGVVTTTTGGQPSDRTAHSGVIAVDSSPPVRVVRRLIAQQIGSPAPDVRVYEFAENVSARVKLELSGATTGVRLEVVHGEKLDQYGRVDTTNIRLPNDRDRERQVLAYTAAGGHEVASPWFASFGFRYVEVRHLRPDVTVNVSAGVLHSAAEPIGRLISDSPELNRMVDMAVRTQFNNTPGFPSDCPTREQGGWTGDASISAEAALAHIDMVGVYRNWLTDVALDAQVDGGILGVSPNLLGPEGIQPADPVWGSAMTEIPWQAWWATGDLSMFESLRPAMRRWADWQVATLVDGIVSKSDISYGADWLALEQTPPVLLQTGAVVTSLRQLADLEEASGAPENTELRRKQATIAVDGARRHLRDDVERSWGSDSQASNAVAVVSGLAEVADHALLGDRLRLAVAARGDRLSSGFPGTKAVVEALARADGGTALLASLGQTTQPGIGSMLVDGPGTFWETWWIDNENVGVASLDHIGLGAPYAAWAWRYVAGLRATAPGFRRFTIDPCLVGLVNSMSFERLTPRGAIRAEWRFEPAQTASSGTGTGTGTGGVYSLAITVPVGAVAEIVLPGPATEATVDARRYTGGRMLSLGSGTHFVVATIVLPERTQPFPHETHRQPQSEVWLSDGVSSTWTCTTSDATVRLDADDIICVPVYHQPIPAPTISVHLDDFAADTVEWFVLDARGRTFDLSAAAFVFASFDVDGPGLVGRQVRPLLRLTSADGSVRTASARPLPVAWNRVALEIADWPGRAAVVEVAVGLRWSDVHDTGRGSWLPLAEGDGPHEFEFRVGRVGWTSAPRTF